MNEKQPAQNLPRPTTASTATMRSGRPRRLCATVMVAVLSLALLCYHVRPAVSQNLGIASSVSDYLGAPHQESRLVPLEAHIMSKCPDARDCLRDLILPTMQRTGDKVNFTLSFIGTPTENDGVECMHGPGECMGDIIELCAAKLYPDPKTYLGFTMCITRDYPDIPERRLIEDCALEHAVDIQALNDCATKDDGAYGIGMLRDSVRRSTEAGVQKSCTVRLDEEVYCVRDGGEWVDCPQGPGVNDLVIAIQKKYRSS